MRKKSLDSNSNSTLMIKKDHLKSLCKPKPYYFQCGILSPLSIYHRKVASDEEWNGKSHQDKVPKKMQKKKNVGGKTKKNALTFLQFVKVKEPKYSDI